MGRGLVQVTPDFLARVLEAGTQVSGQIIEFPRGLTFVGMLPSSDLARGRLWLMVESPDIADVPVSEDPPTVEIRFRELKAQR